MSIRALLSLTLILLPPVAATLAQGSATKDQIDRWVRELGDNEFAVRELASQSLWRAGRSAERAVSEAARSGDAEVTRRAQEILQKFRWGIFADTPPKVLELITRYRIADTSKRTAVASQLFEAGGAGWAALVRIAVAEENVALRDRLRAQVAKSLPSAVPTLLGESDANTLDELVELSAAAEVEGGAAGYALYLLLRGRLDEAVVRYRTAAERPDAQRTREILVYLLRAHGDLTATRAAAEKTTNTDLIELILSEQNDWKALAARPLAKGDDLDLETLGFRAAYQRLAGDGTGSATTLAALRKLAESRVDNDNELWIAAKALFVNDRPQDALALLERSPRGASIAFEVLCAQLRYREAFALAERLPENHAERPSLDLLRARTLHLLGEKEKAQTLLKTVAARLKPGTEAPWEEKLIDTEYRLGLVTAAHEHCALILISNKLPGRVDGLLGTVFPGRGEGAGAWWRLLRGKTTDETAAATLQRVAALIGGKVSEKDLSALVNEGDPRPNQPVEEWEALFVAAADAALVARREEEARLYLERAAGLKHSAAPVLRLADGLAARKEWPAAAARYAEAWTRQPLDPLPLWLRGQALTQAGQTAEGKKWQEAARLLPLGNEAVRFTFAEDLERRGHRAAAQSERELLLRTGVPRSFYAGEARRLAAIDAYARGDHDKAAALHERAVLRCIASGVSFAENGAYVGVPYSVHRLRARGHIVAGRLDEARREIALCRTLLPGDADLPILLVPELEKRGERTLAEEVFDSCFVLYIAVCRDYPRSAWSHNSLAWLGAACRRRLDTAREHAQKAVALAPENASYHDTLGEVYFQKGDREKALVHARRSVELAPARGYFRKQLKRIEGGDPKATLPRGEND